ncbi:MAG: transposase zinc-binding domain-containing protein [Sphingobacteriales bacterium]|nr:transposase zinc-binding domain-containing protein [Sphingobacteriales bacterium]
MQSKIFAHPEVKTFNSYSQAVLSKLSRCHTSGIGVHQYRCSNEGCSHVHYQYHSCGNRHCPNCGGTSGNNACPTGHSGGDRRPHGRAIAHYLFSYSVYFTTGVKITLHGQ